MESRSKKKLGFLWAFVIATAGLMVTSGCNDNRYGYKQDEQFAYTSQSGAGRERAAQNQTPPTTQPAKNAPAPRMADGLMWSSLAFPTGDRATSGVLIEKGIPREVSVGQTFEYIIRVTNLTDLTLNDVVVTDALPENFNVDSATPNWQSSDGGVARWVFSNLGPRESREIRVSGSASDVGTITACATVSYNTQLCTAINVVQPALRLVKEMTPNVLQCEEIIVRYIVSNNGSGPAQNVEIVDNLPDGLVTVNDKSSVRTPVGVLAAGESKTFEIRLKANQTGTFTNRAVATADGGLESESSDETVVTKPQLAITKEGPETLFTGRNLTYTINVQNTGNGEARNTVISDALDSSVEFVSASDGGALNGSNVTWNVGTLAVDGSKQVTLTVKPTQKKVIRNTASVTAFCADAVTATDETDVQGIPAILLEVVDITDPVEVGEQTTYVITATNQGSAIGRNIRIVCMIEDEAQFVSADNSQTAGSTDGNTITFAPLPELAVGAKATWRVTVRAIETADIRFKVTMTEDQLTRPVEETEATNFYRYQ